MATLMSMPMVGCTFNLGSKTISARPGTRLIGTTYTEPDGDVVHQKTSSIKGDGVMFILRVRDRNEDEDEKRGFPIPPKPPWQR